MAEWEPIPSDPYSWTPGPGGGRVGYGWTDFGGGGPVRVGAAGHPLLDGGAESRPAIVQMRFSEERPAADDPGEVLEFVGQRLKRLSIPSGMRLWLKAHVSALDVLVERA